eukprot:2831098-Prymnesium_polylepis.1
MLPACGTRHAEAGGPVPLAHCAPVLVDGQCRLALGRWTRRCVPVRSVAYEPELHAVQLYSRT